jgi:trichoplein keratin filament-binding protein
LLRQHKAKLRQRTKEIQESLELDLRILKMISDTQEKQKHLDVEKRLKAKADAENMIQVLNQQLRLEKEREAELESMFQDEAAKEWDRRNMEWERERVARENLMKQVLNERKEQMNFKFNLLKQQKEESIQRREELVKDMEKTQALAIREREKSARLIRERKEDIESQITSRKEVFEENILNDIEKYEQEQIKENQYKQFMNLEKDKQAQDKFEPKVCLFLIFHFFNIYFLI